MTVAVMIGLVILVTGAFSYRGWQHHNGPMAGTWRVVSVDGKGFANVDVRSIGATFTVTDDTVRGRDDINTYTATWAQPAQGVIHVTGGTASAVGRGPRSSREAQAIEAADTVLYDQGSFRVATHGSDATATRDGVSVQLQRH